MTATPVKKSPLVITIGFDQWAPYFGRRARETGLIPAANSNHAALNLSNPDGTRWTRVFWDGGTGRVLEYSAPWALWTDWLDQLIKSEAVFRKLGHKAGSPLVVHLMDLHKTEPKILQYPSFSFEQTSNSRRSQNEAAAPKKTEAPAAPPAPEPTVPATAAPNTFKPTKLIFSKSQPIFTGVAPIYTGPTED